MKKLHPLFPFLVFFFITCEDKKEEDTTPPTVSITFSPIDYVSEIVSITCISTDNEGVEKVELWVNGVYTGISDNTEPYSLDWNTTTYENSSYVITVRSYDTSGNTTDSDPITLIVQNCTNCGGGLVDGYMYKEVSVADLTSLGAFGYIEVGVCIRYKRDGNGEWETVQVVDDCCCTLYP